MDVRLVAVSAERVLAQARDFAAKQKWVDLSENAAPVDVNTTKLVFSRSSGGGSNSVASAGLTSSVLGPDTTAITFRSVGKHQVVISLA
jgi:hypothetical protein